MTSIISFEIVPDFKSVVAGINTLKQITPEINTLNIPDIPNKFSERSWDICVNVDGKYNCIPHIRASDCNEKLPLPFAEVIHQSRISKILLVSGDEVGDKATPREKLFAVQNRIKEELPWLQVYGAIDPYRSNITKEVDYIESKIKAGFCGFFTQPFFCIKFLLEYQKILNDIDVFWGLCPVITDSAKSYWEKRNKVIFPNSFQADLGWNIEFGLEFLQTIQSLQENAYIMPIKVPLDIYLKGLFR